MDLNYSPEEQAFEAEVRDFLATQLPRDISERVLARRELTRDDMVRWHAILNEKGWLAGPWPRAFGGQAWGPVEAHIFEEECCRAGAPRIVPFGVRMLGPVLMEFGTAEQQAEYLPRILGGRDWWCQGYSEPGAGSDLASLKTRAERDGDDYIVNGQKTWTTLGQYANRIFCLVRTKAEGKPQEGISFLLIDLDTPGIEMRPIRLIEGGYEVNEVFFTDVRVPVTNLVGSENDGWTIAKFLLGHERTNIAGVGFSLQALEQVKALARTVRRNGKPLIENTLFAARIAAVEAELEAMKITNLRMLAHAAKGGRLGAEPSMLKIKGTQIRQTINDLARRALGPAAAPFPSEELEGNLRMLAHAAKGGRLGAEPSMLKIKGTQIRQTINDLARRALGPAAAPFPSEELEGNLRVAPAGHANDTASYFNNRKISIYGGSNEIQRNILAKGLMQR